MAKKKKPLHVRIKEKLMQRITSGVFPPGGRIPAESTLAAEFGVSIATVRSAVSSLVSENILSKRQGSGTYLTQYSLNHRRSDYLRIYDQQNRKVNPHRFLTGLEQGKASVQEAEILQLNCGVDAEVIRFRFTAVDQRTNEVISLVEMVVPLEGFENLVERKHFLSPEVNQYGIYSAVCGVIVTGYDEAVFAKEASPEIARKLELLPHISLLYIERISYTYGKKPVEYRRRYVRPDYHYKTTG